MGITGQEGETLVEVCDEGDGVAIDATDGMVATTACFCFFGYSSLHGTAA